MVPFFSKGASLAVTAQPMKGENRIRDTLSKLTKGQSSTNNFGTTPKTLNLLDKPSMGKLKRGDSFIKSPRGGDTVPRDSGPSGRNGRSPTKETKPDRSTLPMPQTMSPGTRRRSSLMSSAMAFTRKDSSVGGGRREPATVKNTSKLPGLRATIQTKLQLAKAPIEKKGTIIRPTLMHGKGSGIIPKGKNYDHYSGENKEIDNTLLNMRLKNNKTETGKPDFFSRGGSFMKPADQGGQGNGKTRSPRG